MQVSKLTNSFCFRDMRRISEKRHKQSAGKKCNNWDLKDLIEIARITNVASNEQERGSIALMCNLLYNHFLRSNLAFIDESCGTHQKVR